MMVDELEILSNRVDPVRYPRPIVSSLDTWDQATQIDYHHNAAMPGRRAGWNVPSIAVTNESVNTIRSNVKTRFVSPQVPTPAGMFPNPILRPLIADFVPVPNMTQSLQVDSSVQITFFCSVQTASANDFVRFAIFRDNKQISQMFQVTTGIANSPTSATGSYTDTAAPMGRHVYQLRWASGSSLATANYKNRTFQVSNLRAQ